MAIKLTAKSKKNGAKKEPVKIIENIFGAKKSSKKLDPKMKLFIAILAVVLIAVVVALVTLNRKSGPVHVGKEQVVSKNQLPYDVKEPDGGDNIVYSIEGNNISKVAYQKTVSDGSLMNFIMRTSSSTEEIESSIGLDVEFAYTPIKMTVVCDDGSEVPVESRVALDENSENMKYMKALWYDNDKYYSMVTDNLVTREDFLQEVNRVIIANHEEF
ncbi:MAG: hypothetical protein IKP66_10145 [Lachnospiraceae bacterium]|nr:hypothetical protein [Lachnospiraceae bacterium]